MTLPLALAIALGLSSITMPALFLGFLSPASKKLRIREEATRKLKGPKVVVRMALNGLLSISLTIAIPLLAAPYIFYAAPPTWWRGALEAVGALLVYDFAYYFMHRYPFHQWKWTKRVHSVHHVAKHPIAVDSLYLHPVENVLGLVLLHLCIFAVGPISVYSYLPLLIVYTQVNIFVHCGLDLPGPLGFVARKHDAHHASMRAGNYASITPLPDRLFGTAE